MPDEELKQALIASRQRYKDMVDMACYFGWETDGDGCIQFITPNGVLGYGPDDLIGQPSDKLYVEPNDDPHMAFVSQRYLLNHEVGLKHRDGSTKLVRVTCSPLNDEAGNWIGTRGVCTLIPPDAQSEVSTRVATKIINEPEKRGRTMAQDELDVFMGFNGPDATAAAEEKAGADDERSMDEILADIASIIKEDPDVDFSTPREYTADDAPLAAEWETYNGAEFVDGPVKNQRDLLKMDEDIFQLLMRSIDRPTLLTAMKGASAGVHYWFLENLKDPYRLDRMNDLSGMYNPEPKEFAAAMRRIMNVCNHALAGRDAELADNEPDT